MANVKNINGYDLKDAVAREDIATLNNEINNETTGLAKQVSDLYEQINDSTDGILTRLSTVESDISNFNLTIFEDIDNNDITIPNGTLDTSVTNLHLAKSSDGSIAKIYGQIKIDFNDDTGTYYASFPTSLRPEEEITISTSVSCRTFLMIDSNTQSTIYITSLTIGTDGTVTTGAINIYEDVYRGDIFLQPFLLFIKDFGDVPTPPEE